MAKSHSYYLRSITYTIDIFQINNSDYQQKVEADIIALKEKYQTAGIRLRTVRFNILKISSEQRLDYFSFIKQVEILANFSSRVGIRWFNIAFDLVSASPKDAQHTAFIAFEILKRYSQAFVNFIVSDDKVVNPHAIKVSIELMGKVAKLSPNGYDNFRYGISVNPAVDTPFFPFSFSNEKDLSYSIAVEIAGPVIDIIRANSGASLEDLRTHIIDGISPFVSKVQNIALEIEAENGVEYKGQDLSLAPFPDDDISVIEILHLLGLDEIGSSGTMFFTAYLTETIKSIISINGIKAAGFNGVMYSLLEDHLMCKANDMKLIDINSIISYSTLCGCGLDMVPIPGNFLIEELCSIVLDVATVAIRLKKPLGVRVLAIPNKAENEFTQFDMDFLTNTRVMGLKNFSCAYNVFEQKRLVINR